MVVGFKKKGWTFFHNMRRGLFISAMALFGANRHPVTLGVYALVLIH
jgi:hypothetical protein